MLVLSKTVTREQCYYTAFRKASFDPTSSDSSYSTVAAFL